MFRGTSRLLHCRITFFTRTPCGLCDTAKNVVQNVKAKRALEYHEVNVMDAGQEKWKAVYEFDTPVVSSEIYESCKQVPECHARSTSTRRML
jgi:hypothetical protein